MLSILVVFPAHGEPAGASSDSPSVEILSARGADDALEKLGRNRRIDAVLLAAGAESPRIEEAIREDEPAPPPIFRASPDGSIQADLARVLDALEK